MPNSPQEKRNALSKGTQSKDQLRDRNRKPLSSDGACKESASDDTSPKNASPYFSASGRKRQLAPSAKPQKLSSEHFKPQTRLKASVRQGVETETLGKGVKGVSSLKATASEKQLTLKKNSSAVMKLDSPINSMVQGSAINQEEDKNAIKSFRKPAERDREASPQREIQSKSSPKPSASISPPLIGTSSLLSSTAAPSISLKSPIPPSSKSPCHSMSSLLQTKPLRQPSPRLTAAFATRSSPSCSQTSHKSTADQSKEVPTLSNYPKKGRPIGRLRSNDESTLDIPVAKKRKTTKVEDDLSKIDSTEEFFGQNELKREETLEKQPSSIPISDKKVLPPPKSEYVKSCPSWLPRQPPVKVLDEWHHGQLVWWNRFLANRKKTRGFSVGYHVGRVVDLESEWFPSVDLVETKKRLKLQASLLGRRSVFVQSMDDLRYMAIPPRAISPFPDPDDTRHETILEGCRLNAYASFRGLLRGLFVEELRKLLDQMIGALSGEPNTLLEIELFNLFFQSQDDVGSNDIEIAYLQSKSVVDLLHSRQLRPDDICDETRRTSPPILAATPADRRLSRPIRPVHAEPKKRQPKLPTGAKPGRPRKRKDEDSGMTDDEEPITSENRFEMRPRRRKSSFMNMYEGGRQKIMHSIDVQNVEQSMTLCKNLLMTRKQIAFLFRGLPFTLLASPTGIPFPEELPSYTFKILHEFFKFSDSRTSETMPADIARLISYHHIASNLFLHQLCKTVIFRIIKGKKAIENPSTIDGVSPPLHRTPYTTICRQEVFTPQSFMSQSSSSFPFQSSVGMHLQNNNNNNNNSYKSGLTQRSENKSIHHNIYQTTPQLQPTNNLMTSNLLQFTSDQQIDQQQQRTYPLLNQNLQKTNNLFANTMAMTSTSPDQSDYNFVFCFDHTHVNSPDLKFDGRCSSLPYELKEPIHCVSYLHYPWDFIHQNDQNEDYFVNGNSCKKVKKNKSDEIDPKKLNNEMKNELNRLQENDEETNKILITCKKSTLLLIGQSPDLSYFKVKLSQISGRRPNQKEIEDIAKQMCQNPKQRFLVSDLERRFQRLQNLKDVSLRLQTIYDDVTSLIQQNRGNLTLRDCRYFESLWIEVLRKLK